MRKRNVAKFRGRSSLLGAALPIKRLLLASSWKSRRLGRGETLEISRKLSKGISINDDEERFFAAWPGN